MHLHPALCATLASAVTLDQRWNTELCGPPMVCLVCRSIQVNASMLRPAKVPPNDLWLQTPPTPLFSLVCRSIQSLLNAYFWLLGSISMIGAFGPTARMLVRACGGGSLVGACFRRGQKPCA